MLMQERQEVLRTLKHSGRRWQDFVKPNTAIINQLKGALRRELEGDKVAASKMYDRLIQMRRYEQNLADRSRLPNQKHPNIRMPKDWGEEDQVQYNSIVAGPLLECLVILQSNMEREVALIEEHVYRLPFWSACEPIRGVGAKSVGIVLGEIGDLFNYDNPSKVWARMGVGLVDGERQRNIKGNKVKNLKHGYSRRRRAVLFNAMNPMLKVRDNPFTLVYYARKKLNEEERMTDEILKTDGITKGFKGYRHNEAVRIASKRFLKWLWQQWRKVM